MPEANVLYSVTAAVVLGLVSWVAVVLTTAKEPWARELTKAPRLVDDVPLEPAAETAMTSEGAPAPRTSDPELVPAPRTPDVTAEATAVVVPSADDAKKSDDEKV